MTYEEKLELAKTCRTAEEFTEKCSYIRGREEAMKDIAGGKENLTERCPQSKSLFDNAWIKGYNDYYHAWEVLNGVNI
jgi:hypothetical protein